MFFVSSQFSERNFVKYLHHYLSPLFHSLYRHVFPLLLYWPPPPEEKNPPRALRERGVEGPLPPNGLGEDDDDEAAAEAEAENEKAAAAAVASPPRVGANASGTAVAEGKMCGGGEGC